MTAAPRCTMPTASLGTCKRPAAYRYTREGFAGLEVTVAAYCAQHDRAGGHSRMLRPRPWEYDRKTRVADGGRES